MVIEVPTQVKAFLLGLIPLVTLGVIGIINDEPSDGPIEVPGVEVVLAEDDPLLNR